MPMPMRNPYDSRQYEYSSITVCFDVHFSDQYMNIAGMPIHSGGAYHYHIDIDIRYVFIAIKISFID